MKILAHRTGVGVAPENSWQGLIECANRGVAAIECDVTFTRDGEAVIWDAYDQKKLNCRKRLDKINFSEVLDVARRDCAESLLTLRDIWQFLRVYDARIYFDVKYYFHDLGGVTSRINGSLIKLCEEKIMREAIRQNVEEKIGFVSFLGGLQLLKTSKKICHFFRNDLVLIFPWQTPMSGWQSYTDALTIGWKNFNHWKLTPCSLNKIISVGRENDFSLHAGLANTPEEVLWVAERGFDGIWTDNV